MKRKNRDIKWRRRRPIHPTYITTQEDYETLITHMSKESPQRTSVREKFTQFMEAKKKNLNPSMGIMEIRELMKERGWISEDKMIDANYTIIFRREDWHGIQVPNICFLTCTSDRKEIHSIVYELARTCLNIWEEFEDSVPYQKEDGTIEESLPLTKWYTLKKKQSGF
ncbi:MULTISPECIES: hypothetical protein [Bacillus]|uniref:Uncharacterized protein n=2 Tax=Bacillus thuringiensis TaxID=1428 RepID=A0AAP4Q6F8_BACTU|nr:MULTISPECIES: hypothetical protein [Bacillus]MEC0045764.1 hypothetical protein [Bacillus cereus]AFV22012.1 hypothetical protein BTB_502p07070 [Bacillus thuringiensis Bt407]ERI00810.1 hypothetical protein BTCBT_002365 [Bacillus thuringiensis T01-328]MBN6707591.1 hypothetical protein [Bacillus thuringiensis]MDN7078581.1 hypothetical protein [Bacillus thuringiensis]